MKKSGILLIVLFLISGIFYYFYIGNDSVTGQSIKKISTKVIRVIDGDTIEIEGGEKIRLLGINTPEKKEFYANEAINFTKKLENKIIEVEITEKDKYGRSLGYVFFNGKLFNEEILENGFAHVYTYDRDKYSEKLESAEAIARKNEIGIWQKSRNQGCLVIKEFKYKEDGKRCTNRELIVLENICDTLEVSIKDDATHIFRETIKKGTFERNFSCVFNDAGDSLFIWDSTGLLIFERY